MEEVGLEPSLSGKFFEIVGRIFKALTRKKMLGGGSFKSVDDHACIRCSYKADEGSLFPLERNIVFLHKPVLIIRHETISAGVWGSHISF